METLTAAHVFYFLGAVVLGIAAVLLIIFLAYLVLIIKIVHSTVRGLRRKIHRLSLKAGGLEHALGRHLAKGYELLPHLFSFLKKRKKPKHRT